MYEITAMASRQFKELGGRWAVAEIFSSTQSLFGPLERPLFLFWELRYVVQNSRQLLSERIEVLVLDVQAGQAGHVKDRVAVDSHPIRSSW